jgi:hypothetical protein
MRYSSADLRARHQKNNTCDQNSEILNVERSDFPHDEANSHEQGTPRDEHGDSPRLVAAVLCVNLSFSGWDLGRRTMIAMRAQVQKREKLQRRSEVRSCSVGNTKHCPVLCHYSQQHGYGYGCGLLH